MDEENQLHTQAPVKYPAYILQPVVLNLVNQAMHELTNKDKFEMFKWAIREAFKTDRRINWSKLSFSRYTSDEDILWLYSRDHDKSYPKDNIEILLDSYSELYSEPLTFEALYNSIRDYFL